MKAPKKLFLIFTLSELIKHVSPQVALLGSFYPFTSFHGPLLTESRRKNAQRLAGFEPTNSLVVAS